MNSSEIQWAHLAKLLPLADALYCFLLIGSCSIIIFCNARDRLNEFRNKTCMVGLKPSSRLNKWMIDLDLSLASKKVLFSEAVKIKYFAKTIWRFKLK